MGKSKARKARVRKGKVNRGLTTGGGPCNPSIESGRYYDLVDGTSRNNHGQRGTKSTIYFSGF